PGRSLPASVPRTLRPAAIAAGALSAGGVLVLALEKGGYPAITRTGAGVLVWWFLACAAALGLWRGARPRGAAIAGAALLGVFALWTGLSIAWSADTGSAFLEFDRAALYVGIFALAALAASGGTAGPF